MEHPMISHTPTLEERFTGCLLGLAVGDALGAHFEGQSADFITRRYLKTSDLIVDPPPGELWYTDDTQMAIGVAETLIECGVINDDEICRRFAANYVPQRGYGRGARIVLKAMAEGGDHKFLAANSFPGGSFGNGAAMRVAPVGLMYRHDHTALWEQAKLSALPTHVHPLGIEGAQVLALAVALASTIDGFVREFFFAALAERCTSLEFSGPLRRASKLNDVRDLGRFGNGIEATASVVTAIASFGLTPNSYDEAIGNVILLGGDTDTMAAMAGAVSGAYLGRQAIPRHLVDNLEDGHQGKTYIETLASKLLAAHETATTLSAG
jgi:poly(ADP-ribose) glycohydrolase ARH3